MNRLHLICNAHIDPVWQWKWDEGLATVLSTFRVAAEFCEEFDNFVFNHNEAMLYQWIEEYDPPLFKRIQKLVQAGKWHIMGGWYLQPDCNMPSGESIVRQIIYGQKYFRDKFGVSPNAAVNVDSFGHSRGLVQILAKCGYDAYLYLRPTPDTGIPEGIDGQNFLWVGYDGSKILTHHFDWGYNTLLGTAGKAVEQYVNSHTEDKAYLMCWGVGNHGGGPSRRDIIAINELIERVSDKSKVMHSTPEQYVNEIEKADLPLWYEDLNPVNVGSITSMHSIKALHRKLEGRLAVSEKLSALCEKNGLMAYPGEKIYEAYEDLMFSEFHDSLPGTMIRSAEKDTIQKLDHGLEICEQIIAKAFFALSADQPRATGTDIPIIIVNPHPYEITDDFECEYMLQNQNWDNNYTVATVYDGDRPLPSQMEKEGSNMPLDWHKKISFHGTLKPMSANRFDCKLRIVDDNPRTVKAISQVDPFVFENGYMKVVLDPSTGSITEYVVNGRNYAAHGLGELLVYEDCPNPWRLRETLYHGKLLGKFKPLSRKEAAVFAGTNEKEICPINVIDSGEVRTLVEVLLGFKTSRARLVYVFSNHSKAFEIKLTLYWNEKDTLLKLNIPNSFDAPQYAGEDMFGVKPLNKDYEQVAHKWVMACENDRALAVINQTCYGLDTDKGGIRLSLLRSPAYSCHDIGDRMLMEDPCFHHRMDQNESEFRFRVLAGDKENVLIETDKAAQYINEAPVAISYFPGGEGKSNFKNFEIKNVRLDALKKAEDGNGYIMHLFNTLDKPVCAEIKLDAFNVKEEIDFGNYELKTYRVNDNMLQEITLIDEIKQF
ncbi:MAG: alpha-mannosidase [Clostridia bacterium]|nr:alpha-mannosidase [Clostridia bacterium]